MTEVNIGGKFETDDLPRKTSIDSSDLLLVFDEGFKLALARPGHDSDSAVKTVALAVRFVTTCHNNHSFDKSRISWVERCPEQTGGTAIYCQSQKRSARMR